MRFVSSLFIALLVSTVGYAQVDLPDMSLIDGETLSCVTDDEGARFAFNVPSKRVWQSDVGEAYGIELQIDNWLSARCPNTFNVDARLGDFALLHFDIRGCGMDKAKMTVTLNNADGEMTTELQGTCENITKTPKP